MRHLLWAEEHVYRGHQWGVNSGRGTTSYVLLRGPRHPAPCRCPVDLLAEGMKEEGPSLNLEQTWSLPRSILQRGMGVEGRGEHSKGR